MGHVARLSAAHRSLRVGCERADGIAARAGSGRGAGARRLAIGGRAAPASVRSSGDALTARIHATERCAWLGPIDRRAARSRGAVVFGEPVRTLAQDDLRVL